MCGIFFSVSSGHFVAPDNKLIEQLQARGPDSCQRHNITISRQQSTGSTEIDLLPYHLTFLSTVLALRGSSIQVQPLLDEETQSVLCWNGEAWKIDGESLQGNDTARVFQLLLAAAKIPSPDSCQRIVTALTSIAGPFSFVFFDGRSSKIYYGRDRLGRRSLMTSKPSESALILSSVSRTTSTADAEVRTDGIHCVNLKGLAGLATELLPWTRAAPAINRTVPSYQATTQSITPKTVDDMQTKLLDSLRLRVADISNIATVETSPDTAKVAVLFSGGVDCAILARLTHDLLPLEETVDLLNVAFFNPRSVAANLSDGSSPYELCPDRITGRSSFRELCQTCPTRKWRFVAVNVPYSEVVENRALIIRLMRPHNTEMDLSIAMALFFAARGIGYVNALTSVMEMPISGQATLYRTRARVLVSGLGADELFAGYTRHNNAFVRQGYIGLIEELDLDFQRIGKRNLGRDDRVMSYWAREIRYPYLDEEFLEYALALNVWEKCGFGQEDSTAKVSAVEPAKKVLRMLAIKLGLTGVAKEKKRAIQFGARTAKMETGRGKRKGTDVLEQPSWQ